MRLKNKICIITGGGSGIGREACLLFASEGATVVVADKSRPAADAVAKEIGDAISLEVDVTSSPSVESMVRQTLDRFGRVDVLVNNAGLTLAGTIVETSDEDWSKLWAVNVTGVFLGCKHVIPVMRANKGGVIVNTASVAADVGIRNRAAYCGTKGAVVAMSKAMAIDHVADNIRINCVSPGTIDTPIFRDILAAAKNPDEIRRGLESRQAMNRLGKPREIANGMLFLASDESSFMTGSVITIDGGMTAQ